MAIRRVLRWVLWAGVATAALLLAVVLSSPLWLRPLAARQAAVFLGRPVEIGRLRLNLGSPLVLTAEEVVIGNPPGFLPGEDPFLRLPRATLRLDAGALLRRRDIVIPLVELDRPVVRAISTPDGKTNYDVLLRAGTAGLKIGAVRVREGRARVSLAGLRAVALGRDAAPSSRLATASDGATAIAKQENSGHGAQDEATRARLWMGVQPGLPAASGVSSRAI
jgi:uncharacterized protein involved in outer membrane biogenesis